MITTWLIDSCFLFVNDPSSDSQAASLDEEEEEEEDLKLGSINENFLV